MTDLYQISDQTKALQQQVLQAIAKNSFLNIVGGNSKSFLGRVSQGEALNLQQHSGVIEYDPRELVITARCGTPLSEIKEVLANEGQMLAFDPPCFTKAATLGGAIASGLSGPRRPHAGAARDFVLGCKLINGKAEVLSFGGQVMKNVAGYDVSRLMVGAFGTLGVLLELSLKVLPKPAVSITLVHPCSQQAALSQMASLLSKSLPIDSACYYNGCLYLRLSGGERAVAEAQQQLPGDELNAEEEFWSDLRDHRLSFFRSEKPLWRIVVKADSQPLALHGEWLVDWCGAQRWFISDEDVEIVRERVSNANGHATLFRNADRDADIFHPLTAPLFNLHKRLKASFDPVGIFNSGKMYAGL